MKNDIEKLLNYDVISEVEKLSGKSHWSEFSELDNMLALSMNINNSNKKEKILKENKDTYFGMSWNYLIELLKDNGFEIGTEWNFVDNQYGKINNEKAVIYYRKDGVVIFAESYFNGKSVNSGECFYELQYNDDLEKDIFNLIHTGCYYDKNKIENKLDIREGLIYNLKKAENYGKFIKKWKNRKNLWILDYMESKNKINHESGYNVWSEQYKEVTLQHILKCPKELQEIVECSL